MEMTPVDKLIPLIMPFCDGVPQEFARRMMMRAVRAFCTDSWIWQVNKHSTLTKLTGASASNGFKAYEPIVVAEDDASIVHVLRVYINGEYLNDLKDIDYESAIYFGTFSGFNVFDGTSIRIVGDFNTGDNVDVVAAITPSLDCKEVPKPIFDRWAEAILYGAIANIKQAGGQMYSDPQGALTYQQMFAALCQKARSEVLRRDGQKAGVIPAFGGS